ncbi:unnamed protein product, partial [Nesidiocoris tenuis]
MTRFLLSVSFASTNSRLQENCSSSVKTNTTARINTVTPDQSSGYCSPVSKGSKHLFESMPGRGSKQDGVRRRDLSQGLIQGPFSCELGQRMQHYISSWPTPACFQDLLESCWKSRSLSSLKLQQKVSKSNSVSRSQVSS